MLDIKQKLLADGLSTDSEENLEKIFNYFETEFSDETNERVCQMNKSRLCIILFVSFFFRNEYDDNICRFLVCSICTYMYMFSVYETIV